MFVPVSREPQVKRHPRLDEPLLDRRPDGVALDARPSSLLVGAVQRERDVGDPVEGRLIARRVNKVFKLGLDERAEPEQSLSRADLVSIRVADLCDAERQLVASVLRELREIDENPLGGLRPEVAGRGGSGPDVRLKHEVEVVDRLAGQPGPTDWTPDLVVGDQFADCRGSEGLGLRAFGCALDEMVGSVAGLTVGTRDDHIVERLEVSGGLEHRLR